MKKIRLRLDILLQEAGINRLTLSKQTGISYPVIDRYYKNTVRQYDSSVLLRICLALGCDIKDLLEIVDEQTDRQGNTCLFSLARGHGILKVGKREASRRENNVPDSTGLPGRRFLECGFFYRSIFSTSPMRLPTECMALPALLRMWLAFLWPLFITLLLTAATAAPASTPMPIPFATFIALFAIVLNLHIHNKHLTRRNAVTISIPAALLVYSAESHPKKGS